MTFSAKKIFLLLVPFVTLTIAGGFLQYKVVAHPETTAHWLSSFGPFLYAVYFLVQTIGILIPPISGAVVQWALIALIGPAKALLIIYLVSTPIYCLNFLIARRFGRGIVSKLIGGEGMKKVDHYTQDAGIGTLIMLKIFLNNFFDYISYGVGLTRISFKQFLIVNFLGGIPAVIINYFIFTRSTNFVASLATLAIMGFVFTGIYTFYHHKIHRRSRS